MNGATLVVDAGLGLNYFDQEIIRLAMRPEFLKYSQPAWQRRPHWLKVWQKFARLRLPQLTKSRNCRSLL